MADRLKIFWPWHGSVIIDMNLLFNNVKSQRMKYSWGDTNLIGRRISYILARNETQPPQVGISNTFQNRKVVKGVVLSKYEIWFVCSWFFWMKKCDHKAMKLYYIKKKSNLSDYICRHTITNIMISLEVSLLQNIRLERADLSIAGVSICQLAIMCLTGI